MSHISTNQLLAILGLLFGMIAIVCAIAHEIMNAPRCDSWCPHCKTWWGYCRDGLTCYDDRQAPASKQFDDYCPSCKRSILTKCNPTIN